jgi:hypothetical protein
MVKAHQISITTSITCCNLLIIKAWRRMGDSYIHVSICAIRYIQIYIAKIPPIIPPPKKPKSLENLGDDDQVVLNNYVGHWTSIAATG